MLVNKERKIFIDKSDKILYLLRVIYDNEKIKKAMDEQRWRVRPLAKELDISHPTLRKIREGAGNVSIELLDRVAKKLNLKLKAIVN